MLNLAISTTKVLFFLHSTKYLGDKTLKNTFSPPRISKSTAFNFLSLSSFRHRPPRRGDTLVTAGRRPADTGSTACRQRPRRGRTLVTAGRRPADTATLPMDSVPGGVAHYSSVIQHPLVRLDAKLPQQSLVFIFKAHCFMMSLLVGDIELHHFLVSLTVG